MAGNTKENLALTQAVKPKLFYGYVVVLASLAIWTVVYGASLSFGIFFIPLSGEFGWTRAMTSGAFSLNFVIHGALGIVMGRLTDKFGPKLTILVFGPFLGLGYLLMSQISAIWQFYLVYGVINGIGVSAVVVPTMTTIARWFLKKRALMTGIVSAGAGIGQTIMSPIAGWLIVTQGWRQSYIAVGFTVLVVTALAGLFLKRDPSETGQHPYGAREVAKQESKNKDPRSYSEGFSVKKVIKTRQFWMLWVIFFCFGFTRSAFTVHIAPFVTDIGFSLAVGASVLAAMGIPGIVGRVVMGSLADRLGNRQAFMLGFALMTIGSLWLLIARELWMLYLFAIIFGFSWGGLATVRSTITAEVFGLGSLGLILGIEELGATLGGAGAPLLAGWIFDMSGSYQIAFLVIAATAAIGVVFSLLLRPVGVVSTSLLKFKGLKRV